MEELNIFQSGMNKSDLVNFIMLRARDKWI